MLKELHAVLAGCKAFYTWETLDALNTVRMACGGHGYASYSGLTQLMTDFAPNCTLEGDNTVMALQTARYLVSCLNKIQKGKPLQSHGSYLGQINKLMEGSLKCKIEDVDGFNLQSILESLVASSCQLVVTAGTKLMEGSQNHKGSIRESWDKETGLDLVEAARSFVYVYTFKTFMERISTAKDSVKPVLTALCCLYGADKLIRYPQGLYESGYMSSDQFKMLKVAKASLLKKIRPDAVGLVDAFVIGDNSLNSALGLYDGNVYDTLWDWVNTKYSVNGNPEIKKIYMEYIKPMKNLKVPKPTL